MEAAPAVEPDEIDLDALREQHGRELLLVIYALLYLDEPAARAVVDEIFSGFYSDWPEASAEGLSARDALYRRAVKLVRAHPLTTAPPQKRSSRDVLGAIASLDRLSEREAVALHNIPREGSQDIARVLGRSDQEFSELLARGQDGVRRKMKGEP